MLNHPTYERLTQLPLTGMARALAEQAQSQPFWTFDKTASKATGAELLA